MSLCSPIDQPWMSSPGEYQLRDVPDGSGLSIHVIRVSLSLFRLPNEGPGYPIRNQPRSPRYCRRKGSTGNKDAVARLLFPFPSGGCSHSLQITIPQHGRRRISAIGNRPLPQPPMGQFPPLLRGLHPNPHGLPPSETQRGRRILRRNDKDPVYHPTRPHPPTPHSQYPVINTTHLAPRNEERCRQRIGYPDTGHQPGGYHHDL